MTVPRSVLVENLRLFLVHIKSRAPHLLGIQCRKQCLRIYQRAARGVDNKYAVLHFSECGGIEKMMRLRGQRTVKRYHVGHGKKLVDRSVIYIRAFGGKEIIRYRFHAEAAAYVDERAPDLSRSDDPGALSVKVKSGQPDKAEIEVSRSVICARDLPG